MSLGSGFATYIYLYIYRVYIPACRLKVLPPWDFCLYSHRCIILLKTRLMLLPKIDQSDCFQATHSLNTKKLMEINAVSPR